MNWLAKYYDDRALQSDRLDFLRQVGHTERGKSISEGQFQAMLASLRARLDLRPGDVLLDLCCGNGVFTRQLAGDVHHAVGLDFSTELIAIAERHNRPDNVSYHVQDVKHLGDGRFWAGEKFSKILMNGALQHFTLEEFPALLVTILAKATKDRVLLFSFVPDIDKREPFLKSLKPDLKLRLQRLRGRDLIGKWWGRDEILEISAGLGLKAEFLEVAPALDGSRYRFDIRIG